MSSEWFVDVAVTVCLTDFHEIGALFFRNMYPVWDFPEISSNLNLASAYPTISEVPPVV
jgi:hypothetical protein